MNKPAITLDPPSVVLPALLESYNRIRRQSGRLCEPLTAEDQCIQSMPDASPTKWHLAHTSWFFERFVLIPHDAEYVIKHPRYDYLFNSYYNTVGPQHCRPQRGLLSRPTVEEVRDYRQHVDDGIEQLLLTADSETRAVVDPLITLGINHEQQHQELTLTDIKHALSSNPLLPAYHRDAAPIGDERRPSVGEIRWRCFGEALVEIGRDAAVESDFCYDNETPRHKTYVRPFALADRLVTNGEYQRFIEDAGYHRHDLWLSPGWAELQQHRHTHPIYWYCDHDEQWMHYTLYGTAPIVPDEPVAHLSFYEADAFARWCGSRLPTEAEWEYAAQRQLESAGGVIGGNFAERAVYHPQSSPAPAADVGNANEEQSEDDSIPLRQLFGDLWEWTGSQYRPYPGYRPLKGALGEYNAKFMVNQFVLRGGSCATPKSHIRASYRNFFNPSTRWQFTGIRLAKDL